MEFEKRVARQLLILAKTIIKNRNRHLESLGLTNTQAEALYFFSSNPGANIKDLQQHLEIAHQTAQGIVNRMAAKGWISTKRSPQDKRNQLIDLTPEGYAVMKKMVDHRGRTGGLLLKGMTEEEQATFMRLLCIAYDNVKNDGMDESGAAPSDR